MPPSGLSTTTDEGSSGVVLAQSDAPPADSTALLEVEAVTITKRKDGTFKPADVEAATLHTNVNSGVNKVKSARMLFPQVDMENLGELDMQHFAQLEAPPTMLHKPMSCDEVEGHISPVPLLSFTDVKTASFGCADGRDAKAGVFTWGGDFGEFATALNVYEQMATIHLSRADVTNILRKYLEATGPDRTKVDYAFNALCPRPAQDIDGRQAIMHTWIKARLFSYNKAFPFQFNPYTK